LAAVLIGSKWGFIDKSGKIVISPTYEETPSTFSDGLVRITMAGQSSFIDINGKQIILPDEKYSNFCEEFHEGLCVVENQSSCAISKSCDVDESDTRCGYIDKKGTIVISLQFFDCHAFNNGLALIREEYKDKSGRLWKSTYFIDRKGNKVIDETTINNINNTDEYYTFEDFSEELAIISIYVSNYESKSGYIDKTGKIVIPIQFDKASNFSEGLASVEIGHKEEAIDKTGQFVITPQFDGLVRFHEGLGRIFKWKER
jgi:hypothetical protein